MDIYLGYITSELDPGDYLADSHEAVCPKSWGYTSRDYLESNGEAGKAELKSKGFSANRQAVSGTGHEEDTPLSKQTYRDLILGSIKACQSTNPRTIVKYRKKQKILSQSTHRTMRLNKTSKGRMCTDGRTIRLEPPGSQVQLKDGWRWYDPEVETLALRADALAVKRACELLPPGKMKKKVKRWLSKAYRG